MKKLITLFTALLFGMFAIGQTVVFSDDFEAYTAGGYVAEQSTDWETWTNSPGTSEDATISTTQSVSGSQSMNVVDGNDMIYDFGNKTSGIYQVDFEYYVVAGAEAYFNTQHIFGSQWAFSCTFASGTMTLANGQTTSPTASYTEDTWMHFMIEYNMEMDSAYLYMDGTEISGWVFSNQESGGTGENQLGCFNFYGPANNDYYVDDFVFTEVESGLLPPEVSLNTDPVISSGDPVVRSMENTGEEDLNFSAYPVYNWGGPVKSGSRDGILNYDGDYASAIGWASTFDVMAAARYLPEYTAPFAGQAIESVDIYINDLPTNDSIRVYVWAKDGYITPGTSTVLAQKDVTVTATSWNTITLDTPVPLNGDEIWVGYGFNHPDGSYVLGIDGNTLVDNGNYLKTGVVWSEFEGIGGDGMGNFNIRANVVGTQMPEWLTVSPASGSIAASGTQDITIDFVSTGLDNATYYGMALVGCNDPASEWNEIPVQLDYFVGINEQSGHGILTYPNPAKDVFYVKSDEEIQRIQIHSLSGQLLHDMDVNATKQAVQLDMESGIYLVKVITKTNTVIRRVVVQ